MSFVIIPTQLHIVRLHAFATIIIVLSNNL